MRKSKNESGGDVDALFKLPLAEFTGARNGLAAQLKKSGRGDEAADVKALGKPPVSAWAVNQLYWNHREAFDKLIASGERFHKAQSARGGARVADMRAALDARREALAKLSELAAQVLRAAGHNPSPGTIHRITTTLEGISAYASREDGPHPGRLTHDVDPPGFESFGSYVAVKQEQEAGSRRSGGGGRKQEAEGRRQEAGSTQRAEDDKRKVEETREKKIAAKLSLQIAAAKLSLQEAKKSLSEAQLRVRSLEAAKTRAQADVRQAEERMKEVTKRARSVEEDLKKAGREVAAAERRVEDAARKLDAENGK